jgi:uncharacterized protein YyaL (SSP411 family)
MNPQLATLITAAVFTLPLCHAEQPGTPQNRLAKEKSPYLQQHASNPVNWYPWGEEAFAKAREENKPIFLSVGYSTCHWCHVMAHESFENPDIAKVMNENFINIKLDREERPDVDKVYMTFVQATTGSGGWPMSVWLTPDLKPFVGGTYFPPEDQHGRPGFKSLLKRLADAWKKDEKSIRESAGEITNKLREFTAGSKSPSHDLPDAKLLPSAFKSIASSYDSKYGGFRSAPKFPRPVNLDFLHHYAALKTTSPEDKAKALAISDGTLKHMAAGGIHDHLGGGFHRYSVDRYWHIPHYEKMLYDQAQLAVSYLDAARLTGNTTHQETARDILAYVSRLMTGPDGGFYSAEDADSMKSPDADHKTEGAFYIWKESEINELLGTKAPLFNYVYGVLPKGNAPADSDPHGELTGTNTLIRRHDNSEAAEKFKITPAQVADDLATARKTLFETRKSRSRPHLDDKVLTAWNGLMISAFSRAYQDLGDPAYLKAATRAATFIKSNLYDPERGTLLRSYRDGPAKIDGFAADYAFLIQGLLDLYEADFDTTWLAWADTLQSKQDELFWDGKHGGYFASSGNDPNVLLRSKEAYDGAEPSDNSVSALNLQRLAAMLKQPDRQEKAGQVLRSFSSEITQQPTTSPLMLVALEMARSTPAQIVIAGKPDSPDTLAMLKIARSNPRPNQVVLLADGGIGQAFLAKHADFYQSLTPTDGKATAYLCEDFVCQLPTDDPQKLKQLLSGE